MLFLQFASSSGSVLFAIDTDVATLCLCLMGYICRFGSCYLHQNRFPDRSLCDIDNNIAFVSPVAAVLVVVIAAVMYSIRNVNCKSVNAKIPNNFQLCLNITIYILEENGK
jgi:hypothetical protein